MTWKPARRVREFKPIDFAEMSDLSARYGAVNLGQGFPDFPGPGFVKDAAIRAIALDLNQYERVQHHDTEGLAPCLRLCLPQCHPLGPHLARSRHHPAIPKCHRPS